MADTLVERLTGRAAAEGPDLSVNLTITDRTLFAADAEPAHLEGYGTVPAQWARDLVRNATTNVVERGVALWFRTLYTHPVTGALLAMSSRRRYAPGGLAAFIATRDRICRTPYCDAPIRHTDHVIDAVRNGPTSAENTQGLCEACNHTKQAPGWTARSSPALRHLVVTRTPTGHVYRSTAPPGVGHETSDGETYQTPGLRLEYEPLRAAR
ncbi:MAG: HNH endonuclease [Marmoricola sp.]